MVSWFDVYFHHHEWYGALSLTGKDKTNSNTIHIFYEINKSPSPCSSFNRCLNPSDWWLEQKAWTSIGNLPGGFVFFKYMNITSVVRNTFSGKIQILKSYQKLGNFLKVGCKGCQKYCRCFAVINCCNGTRPKYRYYPRLYKYCCHVVWNMVILMKFSSDSYYKISTFWHVTVEKAEV